MKKTTAVLLAFCMLLTLAACSSGNTDPSADTAGTGSAASGEAVASDTAAGTEAASAGESSSDEERLPISDAVPYVDGDDYYEFDCSRDLDENGYFSAINVTDHVTLPESLSVSVPKDVHTASEEDLEKKINEIIDFYGTEEQILNRAVADGDTINIDYVGKLDGVEFEGGNTQGYGTTVTVGVTNYVDDFLQKLIGHKPGETFDIDITFPSDYGNASLAGKATVFTVTINYIAGEKIMPELTDAFVAENLKSNYGWSTVEEMKASISSDLSKEAVNDYLYDYVLNNSEKDLLAFGASCRDVANDGRSFGGYFSFLGLDGATINLGYSYNDEGFSNVAGNNLLNFSAVYKSGAFTTKAEAVTNFGSKSGEAKYDLYGALLFGYVFNDKFGADFRARTWIDFSNTVSSPKVDFRPRAKFFFGNHTILAGVSTALTIKETVEYAVSFPIVYVYAF